MSIRQFLDNLLTSNLKISEGEIVLKKVRLINWILLLAIPINTLFIFANYVSGQGLFALFNFLTVSVMVVTFFYLRRSKDHVYCAAHGTLLGMYLIHAPALLQGGIANSGFVWFFLFPLFSIFLTGRRIGQIWVGVLLLSIVATFIFSDSLDLPYDPIFLIFLLLALIIETFYVLFSQNIQIRYEAELAHKNERLKRLSHNLQDEVDKQIDLIRSRDQQIVQQSKLASVGEMMSFVSHQWKQPLSVISVMVQNFQLSQLLEDEQSTESINALHASILHQTQLMTSTMNDFLKLSNPYLQSETFFIKHAFDIVKNLVIWSFIAGKIELEFIEDSDVSLHGQENELIHAVMNIINNSRDILLEREIVDPKVVVRIEADNDNAVITISDNAGGIADDIISEIFNPYFSTKVNTGGTGLGLYMTKKIIFEKFNASLDVVNSDVGACFTMTFPRNDHE